MVAETPIILSREELIALNQAQAVKITTLIPNPSDQYPCDQSLSPMDIILQG